MRKDYWTRIRQTSPKLEFSKSVTHVTCELEMGIFAVNNFQVFRVFSFYDINKPCDAITKFNGKHNNLVRLTH